MNLVYTALLFVMLVASTMLGWLLRQRLHARFVSPESVDSVRLLMGMLLTFSALVLGLLTSNAKQRFDGYNNDLSAFGANLVELDDRLRMYGPEAAPMRAVLRSYTAAAIADSWPDEPAPAGSYPRIAAAGVAGGVEGRQLGDMIAELDSGIEHLAPTDVFHIQIASRLRDRVAQIVQLRWRLIFSTRATVSWPFLLVLTAWLSIIFAIFGLTSPRNRVVYAVVLLSALSITSPFYLIIDYSEALSGLLMLSSTPLRAALEHMDRFP